MIKPESKRPIAIEDLLRLKRAERPPAEFWSQFDRSLRAKQLAALMARKPWWQRLPSVWPFFVRHRILIGASAVLAVTVVSLRSPQNPAVPVTGIQPAAVASARPAIKSAPSLALAPVSTENSQLAIERAASDSVARIASAGSGSAMVASVGEIDRTTQAPATVTSTGPAMDAELQSASVRFVAPGLVATAPMDTKLSRAAALGSAFEARPVSTRTTVEPLQQMTPPSETRRARLLTAMVSMASLENSARTTERVASRIDDERLYEQVSRFGARGDRLSVKF